MEMIHEKRDATHSALKHSFPYENQIFLEQQLC